MISEFQKIEISNFRLTKINSDDFILYQIIWSYDKWDDFSSWIKQSKWASNSHQYKN